MMYHIKQTENKGKVLIATENLLPGVDLFCEKALFSVDTVDSPEDLKELSYLVEQTGIDIVLWIGFTKFRAQLQPVDQLKIFELYGPTDGARAEEYRTKLKDYVDKHDGWTVLEIEQFVQYCMVASQNAFASNNEDYHTDLFETASRMSHSCQPNCCVFLHTNNRCTVRTISPVQVGHELTISYNTIMDEQPTHKRRAFYLKEKDFLCDCPRCSTPGDDTRQFDCSNQRCNGTFFVCQPTSDVVPYLLPCNVCTRQPYHKYESNMFAQEARLPNLVKKMVALCEKVEASFYSFEAQSLITAALDIYDNVPYNHHQSYAIYDEYQKFFVASYMKTKWVDRSAPQRSWKFADAAIAKAHSVSRMNLSPNMHIASVLDHAAADLILNGDIYKLAASGLQYAQCALRYRLLHHGRNGPDRTVEQDTLLTIFEMLSEAGHAPKPVRTECAFCGETPVRVAITLERCKKCKKVAYCTQHCMEVHWDVHIKDVCGSKEEEKNIRKFGGNGW